MSLNSRLESNKEEDGVPFDFGACNPLVVNRIKSISSKNYVNFAVWKTQKSISCRSRLQNRFRADTEGTLGRGDSVVPSGLTPKP